MPKTMHNPVMGSHVSSGKPMPHNYIKGTWQPDPTVMEMMDSAKFEEILRLRKLIQKHRLITSKNEAGDLKLDEEWLATAYTRDRLDLTLDLELFTREAIRLGLMDGEE